MDPDSPHFRQDWWQICEILPPDPWAYIVSDFYRSDEFFSAAYYRGIKAKKVKIGRWPEKTSPKARIEYAYSVMLLLKDEIKEKISRQKIDLDFVWKWGEYQKAMAILHGALPGFNQRRGIKKTDSDLSMNKALAREWYTLWYEWYKESRAPKKVSRSIFDKYFEKILLEIRQGKRQLPLFPSQKEMNRIINFYAVAPKDKEDLKLTLFFREHKFTGSKYKAVYKKALENRLILPLVGEENYPLKK
jgi:hypothetical protein